MKIPNIPKGKGYLGPEWFGCCNTGRRPSIFHSVNGKWIVGPELAAREALERHLHYETKRRPDVDGTQILIVKTRGSAVNGFNALCQEVEAWNKIQKETYARTTYVPNA